MRALVLVPFLLFACGPNSSQRPAPAVGAPCFEPGLGECSPDGGDLLQCLDGGYRLVDDCRARPGPCFGDGGYVMCAG